MLGSRNGRRGGDPLAVMYVVAALVIGVAAVAVVVMMFIPSDWRENRAADLFIPGGGGVPVPPPVLASAAERPGVRLTGPGKYLAVIEAFNWSFNPIEIRVPAGAEVTFRMRSSQDYHGIAVTGTSILLSLEQSQVREAVHTFDEAGEYPFVCSEYCGAGHGGMTGVIIVE